MAEDEEKSESIESDFRHLGRLYGKLFRTWTVPMQAINLDKSPKEVIGSIRISALSLIAILLLIAQPQIREFGVTTALITLALTFLFVFISEFLYSSYEVKFHEYQVIGSYASMIVCLSCFIFFEAIKTLDVLWFKAILSSIGVFKNSTIELLSVGFWTFLTASALVIVKSKFLDKQTFSNMMFQQAIVVNFIMTAFVMFIYKYPAIFATLLSKAETG